MLLTDKGIVIRNTPYGERDKLITILTENNGKLFFKATGIRNLTSKNAAGCMPYTYSEFVLDRRGEHTYLRRATALRSLTRFGQSLGNIALFAYFSELCEDTVYDEESSRSVMKLFANALYVLSHTDRSPDLIKAIFEMRLLSSLGFMPELEGCALCQKSYNEGDRFFFHLTDGHFLCPKCEKHDRDDIVPVSSDVIALSERSIAVSEDKAYAVSADEKLIGDFSLFAEKYLLSQLEKNYKTLDFYKEVKIL